MALWTWLGTTDGERLVQHSKAMHAPRIKSYLSIHHPGNGLFHLPFPSVLSYQSHDFWSLPFPTHKILSGNSHCPSSQEQFVQMTFVIFVSFHSKRMLLLLTNVPHESGYSFKVYSSTISYSDPQVITSALYRRQRSLRRKSCEIANIRVLIGLHLV